MQETATEYIDMVMTLAIAYGLDIVAAIVTLIIGFWLAGRVRASIIAVSTKSEKLDITVATFLASLARYAVIAVTVIAVLERFGVQTTSFVALLGAMGLAVGLALQGTLGHLASGVMLLIFRPFKVGQFVDTGGHAGTIKSISLFTTEMDTPDNVRIIIPNGSVWGAAITNFSHHTTRRLDMVYGVGYGDDLDKAMDVIKGCIEADDRSMSDPESLIVVSNLGDSSVDITVRVWCAASDYWGLKFDLTKKIKESLDTAGIDIPYPQTVIHSKSG